MALGSNQPLKEKSTRSISWGIKAASAKGSQTCHRHVPIVLKSGNPSVLEISGLVQACSLIALPLPLTFTANGRTLFITKFPYKIHYYLHNSAELKHVLS
jgi:hypothetical protein